MQFQEENHKATQNDRTDYIYGVPSFSTFRRLLARQADYYLAVKFNTKGTQTQTERQAD